MLARIAPRSLVNSRSSIFFCNYVNFGSHAPSTLDSLKMGPGTRFLIMKNNLNPKDITPTGPQGRILKGDVLNYLSKAPPKQKSVVQPRAAAPVKKTAEQKQGISVAKISHFYASTDCSIDNLQSAISDLNSALKLTLSIDDLIVKAFAKSVKQTQQFKNETLNFSAIIPTAKGNFFSQTIPSADSTSVLNINKIIQETLANPVSKESQGENFASVIISRQLGVDQITEIIEHSEKCVLTIGGTQKRVVVGSNGFPVVGNVVSLTLSCDSTVFSYESAAQILDSLQNLVQNPNDLLTI